MAEVITKRQGDAEKRRRLTVLAQIEQSEGWRALKPLIDESVAANVRHMAEAWDAAVIHRHQGCHQALTDLLSLIAGATQRLRDLPPLKEPPNA